MGFTVLRRGNAHRMRIDLEFADLEPTARPLRRGRRPSDPAMPTLAALPLSASDLATVVRAIAGPPRLREAPSRHGITADGDPTEPTV